jgi:DNA-binding NtrC family response regulator
MDRPLILVLEDKPGLHPDLPQHLSHQGFKVVRSCSGTEALDLLQGAIPDLAIININHSRRDLETVKLLRRHSQGTPVILIVQESSESRAIAALRAGINDYFKHPVSCKELLDGIRRLLPGIRAESFGNQPGFREEEPGPGFIGETPLIRKIKDYIVRAAAIDCNVLITGETGTGKEKVAELIHWQSARREHPMICINCAALPENLLESELFGFERGAFTGASEPYPGKLRLAEGGIVFLDEIFTMSPFMQAKLLRALDTRKIYSLGGKKPIPLNIRVVAATNQDPEVAMEEGSLRQDLFYRLNVARVHLPPLRERQADIPLLLMHFLREMNRRYGRRVESVSPEVMELLLDYGWPGNIRELRNLVEALFINLAPQARCVSLSHLPEAFQRLQENREAPQEERMQLLHALLATNWNKSEAAQKLRISRMTLYRKMEKHEIQNSQGLTRRLK